MAQSTGNAEAGEALHDRVAAIEDDLDRHNLLDPLEMAAIRKTLVALAGYQDADDIPDAMTLAKEAAEQQRKLHDRIKELEGSVDRLSARQEDAAGKEQKVAAIVQYAAQRRDGQGIVQLQAKEVKGACGCSRRYAYDLIDDLPDQYDWALHPSEISQYGDLEIDKEDGTRRLAIDFEGVYTAGCDVNKFTTPPRRKEGEK